MGLLSAVLWGGGDFSGGMGVKDAGGSVRAALRIILLSHVTSFCILVSLAMLHGDQFPQGAPLLWGLGAGVAGGLSLACFYIALSRGAMGAAAAVSGVLAAAIPATVSIAREGSPGTLRLLGFVVAGAAIWMIAASPAVPGTGGKPPARSTTALALCAGAGFGVYFVALKMAGTAGVIWPMGTARIGSVTTCSLLLLLLSRVQRVGSTPFRLSRAAVLWSLSTAVLDTTGNLLFVSATRAGRLDVAAVLASLYPASTILLATWMLKEKFSVRQAMGMGVALVAVAMITL